MARGGKRPGAGRPKGAQDAIARGTKEYILDVLKRLETENKGLYEEAQKDPRWFYANFIKPMLPKEIDLTTQGELTVVVKKFSE